MYIKAPLKCTELTGCGETCSSVVSIKEGTETLYYLNLADMIIEILAFFILIVAVCKMGDGSPIFILSMMFCFAFTDFVLQIIALVVAENIQGATEQLQAANCLDVTQQNGLEKHSVLIKVADSVGLSLILGYSELALTFIEGCLGLGLASMDEKKTEIWFLVLFQFFETLLTTIDFSAVTTVARTEMLRLFATESTTEWCTIMNTTSTACIVSERKQPSGGT